jgi:hypothetical protein
LLIYDERRSRWRGAAYTDVPNMVYSEPNTVSSLLIGATDGNLMQIGGLTDGAAAADVPVEFRTGAIDEGRPLNLKQWADIIIDIDPGGATVAKPVIVTPLINGEAQTEMALPVTGSGRQRIPLPLNQSGVEVYAYNIEFDFRWLANATIQPKVYQYDLLYRHEPSELTYWQLPPTTFGVQGYLHVRDIYLTMRSTVPTTFTVTPDGGVTQTFTLPSTGGNKRKQYVQLAANKAKTYSFTLQSTTGATFRVYADESECRVRQWLSKLGYQNVPVIEREQVGKPFGLVNV